MENNRERADNTEDRAKKKGQTGRQIERHEENSIMISLDCTLLRQRDSKRERVATENFFPPIYLGWRWSETYFSMRSNVTPGTNLALFCIQNLCKNKDKAKLLIRVGKKTRGAHRLDKAIKTFGLYSTNFMTCERETIDG